MNVQNAYAVLQSKPDDVRFSGFSMGTRDSSRHSSMENLGKSQMTAYNDTLSHRKANL